MAGSEEGYLYGRLGSPTVRETAAAIAELEGAEALRADGLRHGRGARRDRRAGAERRPPGRRPPDVRQLDLAVPRPGRPAARRRRADRRRDRSRRRRARPARTAPTPSTARRSRTPAPRSPTSTRSACSRDGPGARLIVDSTLATPLLCRPLEHGAHVVLHSATKFLNGHHDVLAGAICGSADDLRRVRALLIDTGGVAEPDTAWLLRRGMRTLALRMERQCANALAIADWLESRDDVVVGAVSRACRRTRSTRSPVAAARRRLRRRAGVRGRRRPRRRRGGHERHAADRALDVARRHRHAASRTRPRPATAS